MGVRDAWQALWRTKQSAGGPLLVRAGIGQPRFTPRRYDRLAEEGYRKNVIAYRCVRLIAKNPPPCRGGYLIAAAGAASLPSIL
jgi:hypothetical protein